MRELCPWFWEEIPKAMGSMKPCGLSWDVSGLAADRQEPTQYTLTCRYLSVTHYGRGIQAETSQYMHHRSKNAIRRQFSIK